MRGEAINVGVLVHVPEEKFCHFYKTKNLTRIKNFDDELEIDVIKVLLESLEYQFNTNTIHSPDLKGLEYDDFLEKETSYYVNQFQFSNIKTFSSDDLSEDIEDLCNIYLYYDKKKSERIDKYKVKSLVSKIITSSKLKPYVDRNPKLKNNFQQQAFDFSLKLNNHETLIKALSLDYRRHNKMLNEIKSFLYDLLYFKYSSSLDTSDIKVVVNNTQFEKKYERIAVEELKKFIEVYTLEEFSKFIDKTESILYRS
jgi:hypothetical protein